MHNTYSTNKTNGDIMDSSTRKGGDFARPRRPNVDTIAYLKSLPLDIEVAHGEISNFCNDQLEHNASKAAETSSSMEFPSALGAALTALDEIRLEVASLAGDERGAEVLEVLIKITAPYSITAAHMWLLSCQGYAHHLALHRYGSHVLQTILEQSFLSSSIQSKDGKDEDDLALHPESPTNLVDPTSTDVAAGTAPTAPTTPATKDDLWDLFGELQQELLPAVSHLTTHLCGTHVLRTLFLILAGIESVRDNRNYHHQNPRRGKAKSKKHGKDTPISSGGSLLTGTIQCIESCHRRPADVNLANRALDEWADAIAPPSASRQPSDLQQLACDASGGPLLMVLLQSLTYRDSTNRMDHSSDGMNAAARSLGKLPHESRFERDSKACVLAERILCLHPLKQDDGQLPQTEDVVYGLSGDSRGSRVVDTILRLCHDDMHERIIKVGKFIESFPEYVEHDVSNFVMQTVLATARNAEVEHFVQACLPMVESGFIVDAGNRRRGILWRLCEMTVHHQMGQAGVLQSLHLKCQRKHLAAMLLDMKRNSDDNRIILNVEGSRALHYLLQFDCPGAREVLEGVVALPVDDLDALARDGLGSRCVWDVVLQKHNRNDDKDTDFSKARTKLLNRLKGRWVSLATDRVGHHTVQNLFRALPSMKAREELVQELAQGRHRLNGNAMGRSILSECAVHVYQNQGFVDWSHRVQKRMEQQEWLGELSSREPMTTTACQNSESSDPQQSFKTSRDRVYQKDDTIDDWALPNKKRARSSMTVDSIFDALTLPQKKEERSRRATNKS